MTSSVLSEVYGVTKMTANIVTSQSFNMLPTFGAKVEFTVLETEIRHARNMGKWGSVKAMAKKLSQLSVTSSPQASLRHTTYASHTLSDFLLCEASLEEHLEKNPSCIMNVTSNVLSKKSFDTSQLLDAKTKLESIVTKHKEVMKTLGLSLDVSMVLSKLHLFVFMDVEGAKRVSSDLPHHRSCPVELRTLKLLAEGFVVRGLCLEIGLRRCQQSINTFDSPAASRRRKDEPSNTAQTTISKENDDSSRQAMIKSYEIASNLSIVYLQMKRKMIMIPSINHTPNHTQTSSVREKYSPTEDSTAAAESPGDKLGVILDSTLFKAPCIHMRRGDVMKAIDRYRFMMLINYNVIPHVNGPVSNTAEECAVLSDIRRQALVRLAEVLLRGASQQRYVNPACSMLKFIQLEPKSTDNTTTDDRCRARDSLISWHTPCLRPLMSTANINVFIPSTRFEELILVLLILEQMSRRVAILSQSPEFFALRSSRLREAIIVYDLVGVTVNRFLFRNKPINLLTTMLDQSMKFSFNERHTWSQFALSLAAQGQIRRCMSVMNEMFETNQIDAPLCLVASRLCLEHLKDYRQGITWAERAYQKCFQQQTSFSNKISSVSNDSTTTTSNIDSLPLRCLLFEGIGYTLAFLHSTDESLDVVSPDTDDKSRGATREARKHNQTSSNYFHKAESILRSVLVNSDSETNCSSSATSFSTSTNSLVVFYLSLLYAHARHIDHALAILRTSTGSLIHDLPCSLLMSLLLTCQPSNHKVALNFIDHVLSEFPDNWCATRVKMCLVELLDEGHESSANTIEKVCDIADSMFTSLKIYHLQSNSCGIVTNQNNRTSMAITPTAAGNPTEEVNNAAAATGFKAHPTNNNSNNLLLLPANHQASSVSIPSCSDQINNYSSTLTRTRGGSTVGMMFGAGGVSSTHNDSQYGSSGGTPPPPPLVFAQDLGSYRQLNNLLTVQQLLTQIACVEGANGCSSSVDNKTPFSQHPASTCDNTAYEVGVQIWIDLGKMFLRKTVISEATACYVQCRRIQNQLFSEMKLLNSPVDCTLFKRVTLAILEFRSELHRARNEFQASQSCLETLMVLQPFHAPTTCALSQMYRQSGLMELCETNIYISLQSDSTSHEAWSVLADIQGQCALMVSSSAQEEELGAGLSCNVIGVHRGGHDIDHDDYNDSSSSDEESGLTMRMRRFGTTATAHHPQRTPSEALLSNGYDVISSRNSESEDDTVRGGSGGGSSSSRRHQILLRQAISSQAIASSLHQTSPVLPFSIIKLPFS